MGINNLIKKIINAMHNRFLGIKTFLLFSLGIFVFSIFLTSAIAKSNNDIKPGDKWKYFKGIKDAPENWQSNDFDDTDWLKGKSGFGYGNNPKNGKIKPNKDGTFTYIPDKGFTGNDTFRYKVKDNKGAISRWAKVLVRINNLGTIGLNSEQASITNVPLNNKNNIIALNDEDSDDKDKDKDKSDFKGTPHVFKDDIDDINEFPDVKDDIKFASKDSEVKIDVIDNDDDTDGTINPETILVGNSEEGELDDMQGRFLGILGRKEFIINDPDEIEDLDLSVICDGPFVAYINGIEVFRNESAVNEKIKLGFAHELFPGKNILAIECSNDDIDSDDFSFVPELEITEKGGK